MIVKISQTFKWVNNVLLNRYPDYYQNFAIITNNIKKTPHKTEKEGLIPLVEVAFLSPLLKKKLISKLTSKVQIKIF